jgi:hypothetical protein
LWVRFPPRPPSLGWKTAVNEVLRSAHDFACGLGRPQDGSSSIPASPTILLEPFPLRSRVFVPGDCGNAHRVLSAEGVVHQASGERLLERAQLAVIEARRDDLNLKISDVQGPRRGLSVNPDGQALRYCATCCPTQPPSEASSSSAGDMPWSVAPSSAGWSSRIRWWRASAVNCAPPVCCKEISKDLPLTPPGLSASGGPLRDARERPDFAGVIVRTRSIGCATARRPGTPLREMTQVVPRAGRRGYTISLFNEARPHQKRIPAPR